MRLGWAALASAAVLAGVPADARTQVDDPALLSELVVVGKTPGPAWWRVSDADSEVYVMVVPSVSLKGADWPRGPLERRMKGANVFILPVELSLADIRSAPGMAGILVQAPRVLLARKPRLQPKDTHPLESRMTPELRAKFVAARERIGQPAERYAGLAPWRVANLLERDTRAHYGLSGSDPFMGGPVLDEMTGLAKRNKVRIQSAYKLTIPAVKFKVQTTDEPALDVQWACLDAALPRIAARVERDKAIVLAWAAGDVRPLLHPEKVPERDPQCVGPGRGVSYHEEKGANGPITRMEEDFVRDQASAIERALAKPGRSVAVLEALSPIGRAEMGMLGKKGVLARLQSRGYDVDGPAELD